MRKKEVSRLVEMRVERWNNGSGGGETGRGNRLYPHKFQPDKDTWKLRFNRESPRLRSFYDKLRMFTLTITKSGRCSKGNGKGRGPGSGKHRG